MKHPVRILGCVSFFGAHVLGKITFPDCAGGPEILTTNLICDTSASPSERASALISAWNITEKLVNLVELVYSRI